MRNGSEALKAAERCNAVARAPSPVFMDSLAMAHAELSQFSQAVAIAEQALNLARQQNRAEIAAGIEQRLALYREGKPYRKNP